MMRRLLLLVLSTLLPSTLLPSTLLPSALPGQQQPASTFTVGKRVRLESCATTSPSRSPQVRRLTGEVIHEDSSMLVLQTRAVGLDTISPSLIANTWQSAGHRSRWVTGLRGLALGAVAGTLLGVGLDAVNDNRTGDGSGEAFESVLLPVFTGLLGASVGAVVGAVSGGEQWKRTEFLPSPASWCASH